LAVSEPVTRTKEWTEIQDATIFTIDRSVSLHFESLWETEEEWAHIVEFLLAEKGTI